MRKKLDVTDLIRCTDKVNSYTPVEHFIKLDRENHRIIHYRTSQHAVDWMDPNPKFVTRYRKTGYIYYQDGNLYYRFISRCSLNASQLKPKKYEPSKKLVSDDLNSWIAVNTDRKSRKCDLGDQFKKVIKMASQKLQYEEFEKALDDELSKK